MLDPIQIREQLFSRSSLGIKYDLNRMVAAAQAIGNPQNGAPCFHVAGTNGKGSVCTFLESALRSSGKKTGMFLSPHLVKFEERFLINGRPAGEEAWLEVYADLRGVIDRLDLTFFEATTLMAFELFRRQPVDWAVYETGLGGRLDATNIVQPQVSVITRLAMDHRELLGNDLPAIAVEKLGIVKNEVPLVMAKPAEAGLEDLALRTCAAKKADCIFVDAGEVGASASDDSGTTFSWNGQKWRINLAGEFQQLNALLALTALKVAGFDDNDAIASGLARAFVPGRFQVFAVKGKTVVFDVGHNPNAVRAFCSAFAKRFGQVPACFVIGIMKDKDFGEMMPVYSRTASRIIAAKPGTPRAAEPAQLLGRIPAGYAGGAESVASVAEAVDKALAGLEPIVCIVGSFFTVGEGMERLGIEPYKTS